MLTAANLTLRFLLELAAIGALGYWGFRAGAGPLGKSVLGLGAPALAPANVNGVIEGGGAAGSCNIGTWAARNFTFLPLPHLPTQRS